MPNTVHNNPGTMNQLVTFVQPVEVFDSYGSISEPSYQTVCQMWAKVKTSSEHIMNQVGQIFRKVEYTIIVRYREGLNESMKIQFQSRTLIINELFDINSEHAYIQLRCTEEHSTGIHSS